MQSTAPRIHPSPGRPPRYPRILGVFVVALTSWIPSLVIEANLVGVDISSRENSKGFVDASFVDATGINAAVGVAGVVLSFHSAKDWLGREWEGGLCQETCKLYDEVMRLLDGKQKRENTDVASVASLNSIFVRST